MTPEAKRGGFPPHPPGLRQPSPPQVGVNRSRAGGAGACMSGRAGYVLTLGVVDGARGHGLAKALLLGGSQPSGSLGFRPLGLGGFHSVLFGLGFGGD